MFCMDCAMERATLFTTIEAPFWQVYSGVQEDSKATDDWKMCLVGEWMKGGECEVWHLQPNELVLVMPEVWRSASLATERHIVLLAKDV